MNRNTEQIEQLLKFWNSAAVANCPRSKDAHLFFSEGWAGIYWELQTHKILFHCKCSIVYHWVQFLCLLFLFSVLQRFKSFDPLWPKNTYSATVSTGFPALEIQQIRKHGNVGSKRPFPYFEQRLRRHHWSEVGGKEERTSEECTFGPSCII